MEGHGDHGDDHDSSLGLAGDLRAEVAALSWFHSIDLGGGVRTPGQSELAVAPELLPPLGGRSVLDIGAWDGYYSFLAERQGATRVVALDHYAWGLDWASRDAYWRECAANGVLPDHSRDTAEFWRPDLPGKRGFDLARRALGSAVEPVVADLMTADLAALGPFDVVLYLGVLYHMKEPLTALERVRQVTREVAVIETEALHVAGMEESALCHFVMGDAVNGDFGNWFVPTIAALHAMCRAAGFSEVVTVSGPPAPRLRRRPGRHQGAPSSSHYRAIVHARP